MTKQAYDRKMILKLYETGILPESRVPKHRLELILKEVDDGTFKVWADENFDPEKRPYETIGVSICIECGRIYWATPEDDAYEVHGMKGQGRVCEPCLVKPTTGEDKAIDVTKYLKSQKVK